MKRILATVAALIFAPGLAAQLPKPGSGGGAASVDTNGLVLLQTCIASASATCDFTAISSTYDNYEFWVSNIRHSTDGADLDMRFSTDGGSSYDSGNNYFWAISIWTNAGGGSTGQSTVDSITVANAVASTASWSVNGKVQIFNPLNTDSYKFVNSKLNFRNTVNNQLMGGDGVHQYLITTAVNAVRFFPTTGTFTGTITMYGLAK